MPDASDPGDRIRRLRRPEPNMFSAADDEREAERMGISLEEYQRGKEVGVWRVGESGPRWPFNARLPRYTEDRRLRQATPATNLPSRTDRPGVRNDT